jgi:hydrogenase nickel incorporation protein HypA/HybF
MHELSVAQALVELVAGEVAREGAARVVSVHIRVGALSGVEPAALRFAYDAATAGTALEGSTLQVEGVAVAVWCERCRAERDLGQVNRLSCPACGAPTPRVVRGKELEVVSVEVAGVTHPASVATAP